ncbi:hypothetical protein JXJ21_25920 [candidate division KSB1 bacterium]|nr:hypothetical protein [candidate division KSB1 bacterium]
MPKNHIGTKNEKSLHAAIKEMISLPGDQLEVRVDGYIIDIVRDDLLIEIQTRNFSSISFKLRRLIQNHKLRLVYPIPQLKRIIRIDPSNHEIISSRKSPRSRGLIDIFDELVRIPHLICHDNFSLEVLLIEEEEIRCNDGEGSWRRKGVSIIDRQLISVLGQVEFRTRRDFLRFVPDRLNQPFTNREIAEETGISIHQSRRVSYTLKKMGVLTEVGRKGNELLFEKAL